MNPFHSLIHSFIQRFSRKCLIFATACLFASGLSAQVKEVSGVVKDEFGAAIIGANVYWANTSLGTTTDLDGRFSLPRTRHSHLLVTSFVGCTNDTINVDTRVLNGSDVRSQEESSVPAELHIILRSNTKLQEVEVSVRRMGTMKMRSSVLNEDMISSAELCRAACCNLGESFTTNPSVDVSYSDAATGAKQIRLLGLSGTYVQMLTENIPNFRGAAAPFALDYVPGPWMQSIQVSKGSSSVKNGYESITGQINVEYKKPQTEPSVNLNLYGNTKSKMEANFDGNIHLNKRLSTALLAHFEENFKAHDGNGDGFVDMPKMTQYNLQNRWAWMGERYIFQAAIKGLKEERNSGQSSRGAMTMSETSADRYRVGIETERYELFAKNAYIFNKERNTNVALILSGSLHEQEAGYGYKLYDVNQKNFYASLMFESDFDARNNLSVGLSLNHDYYHQSYRLENDLNLSPMQQNERETVAGAYAQYTYNLNDRLILMAGIRADHSNRYGNFVTPRAHLKYNPADWVNLRLSVGKGYRTNHVLAENHYLLASSRQVLIDAQLKQEEAWNYGASTSFYLPIAGKTLNVNAEYYFTDFQNQLVVDLDSDPHAVRFSNLEGRSYSHTMQVDASYPFFRGFTLTAAYRYTDAKSTYGGVRRTRPLTNRYKGLLTASYQTPLGLWQFDLTTQLNGGGRMPSPYTLADGSESWSEHYGNYAQLNAQITRIFRHWSIYLGGENMTNYKQRCPIIDASNPWGDRFDSTMIWGPVDSSLYYLGIRVNY